MNRKCIMLIDDSPHDNFFNQRTIREISADIMVICKESPREALEYLRSNQLPKPDLILLDIYMPAMNGWEFLEDYVKLSKTQQCKTMIVMLATSGDPAHIEKAVSSDYITDYLVKPLTSEKMKEISDKYLMSGFFMPLIAA